MVSIDSTTFKSIKSEKKLMIKSYYQMFTKTTIRNFVVTYEHFLNNQKKSNYQFRL